MHMYKVKPVFNDEDIVKFENMRYKAFNYDKEINKQIKKEIKKNKVLTQE